MAWLAFTAKQEDSNMAPLWFCEHSYIILFDEKTII